MAKLKTNRLKATEQSVRYPLHRGPFLFAPHFLTGENWFPEFHSLIERVLAHLELSALVVKEQEGRHALIRFSNSEFTIDGQAGLFSVDEISFSEKDDAWTGPYGTPAVFLRQLRDREYAECLGSERDAIESFSMMLSRFMSQRFERAIQNGAAQITARIGSPFAEASEIELWQLDYFKINTDYRNDFMTEDFKLDEVVAKDGTKLFGIGFTPTMAVDDVKNTVGKPSAPKKRGRPVTVDHDALDYAILGQLHRKGIPMPSKPSWTGEIFAEAVRAELGRDAPKRTLILGKLPPLIQKYKRDLKNKGFQQSAKSKIRLI